MTLQFKKSLEENPYSRMKDIAPGPILYQADKERSVCISFFTH